MPVKIEFIWYIASYLLNHFHILQQFDWSRLLESTWHHTLWMTFVLEAFFLGSCGQSLPLQSTWWNLCWSSCRILHHFWKWAQVSVCHESWYFSIPCHYDIYSNLSDFMNHHVWQIKQALILRGLKFESFMLLVQDSWRLPETSKDS